MKVSLFNITPLIAFLAFFGLLICLLGKNNDAMAYLNGFDPGNIISDAVMSNKNAMSINEIQSFLNSKVPNCTTEQLRGYNNESRAIAPCLKDYNEDGMTSAQIIWQAGQDYSINPQVLIVLLQKEQGLVTDTWPRDGWWWTKTNLGEATMECTNANGNPSYCVNAQYRSATGYGCPDTAPCDSQYFGFTNQIRKAAELFRSVLNGGWTNYPVGNNYIQFNPDPSCGGSIINIKNRATSALYRYTPYQPNAGALSAGWGTAPCGAYGNRNFYNYFTEWFGTTQDNKFVSLDNPRWMQIKKNGVQKVNVYTNELVGNVLDSGFQVRFVDKIQLNGKWYLRTEFNYNDGGPYAISLEDIEEIPYVSISPKWVTFKEDGNRSHPASRASIGDKLARGTVVKVVDQITVDGNVYYRTEYNNKNGGDYGIHSRFLISGIVPIQLDGPRYFCASPASKFYNIQNNSFGSNVSGRLFIDKKIMFNGFWYFQLQRDSESSLFLESNTLTSASNCTMSFENFTGPRNMRLKKDVTRFNPFTNEDYDKLSSGQIIHFSSKIFLNNQWYYRTTHNTLNNIDAVIPASATSEI